MSTGRINRWRLILGSYAKNQISFTGNTAEENGISCMDLDGRESFDGRYMDNPYKEAVS